MNRKGLSPLIATVLLIAFAVALGVMIMTWTQKIPSGGVDCSTISLEPVTICYGEEKLEITIKNAGEIPAGGIVLGISDDGQDIPALRVKNSAIAAGARVTNSVPYVKNGAITLTVTPQIEQGGDLITCKEPLITVKNVNSCQ